jgi:MFS family permease
MWLMTVATGLAVAGNYYAQPLLPEISRELGIRAASAGSIITTAQLGYALGLLLIVPLGDMLERRRLILDDVAGQWRPVDQRHGRQHQPAVAGHRHGRLCSVVAQILLPLGASLASEAERGRVVGTIMSGLLTGILLARTVAGSLADLGGWHTVYWCGTGGMLLMTLVLSRQLPHSHATPGCAMAAAAVGTAPVCGRTQPAPARPAGCHVLCHLQRDVDFARLLAVCAAIRLFQQHHRPVWPGRCRRGLVGQYRGTAE